MPKNQTTAGKSVERGAKGIKGRDQAAGVGLHRGAKGTRADRINSGRKIY